MALHETNLAAYKTTNAHTVVLVVVLVTRVYVATVEEQVVAPAAAARSTRPIAAD